MASIASSGSGATAAAAAPGGFCAAGEQGPQGAEGPTAISTDANNISVLGTDSLTYTPNLDTQYPVTADGQMLVGNTNAWVVTNGPPITGDNTITSVIQVTQAAYDALAPPVATTLYVIIG